MWSQLGDRSRREKWPWARRVHSSTSQSMAVTMDIYSHVLPGLQEQAILALDERLTQRSPK